MVENSLGRLWVEGHPDVDLQGRWKYYLEEAEQEPEVQAELAKIREEYAKLKPEDIKLIDPCMGSGHILVYAFDIFMQIYENAGWSAREAAQSIVEHNIYGLDIDDRAAQLSYFAVMMKARQYDRRIFTRGVRPNVYAIQESKSDNDIRVMKYDSLVSQCESVPYNGETNGFGNLKYAMGNFKNDIFGDYIRYTHASCHSYVVVNIDGKILVVNGKNDVETKEIYQRISEKVSKERK